MITLLVADDHPLYRDALRGALTLSFSDLSLLEAADLMQTVALLEEHKDIDLLLLDLHMPGSGDLFGLIHIRKLFPELPVAVVSGLEEPTIITKVINLGALGFVPKTTGAAQIAQAVTSMLEGDIWLPQGYASDEVELDNEFAELADKVASLTPAQYKVLCYMRDGLLNKQIAYNLDIATATVKAHVTAIFKKLQINNRTQAVLIASQLQLEPPAATPAT
ncbi:response regulator transcription factor [Paraglaciecola chathamensis]|jgi:DNA-binding NarL/FixJ family response regulator|uniref:Response regulator transcription factor n=1 Tax=Paraglaciecola chathamensis TaxID=368405 RepID=A0ABS0WB38_9ALTE|nr:MULTISPECIES: response regulator transcription factor [Paraglaciecola]AEE21561.1 two component transcriptional regulator, LuxR family [Glaciecola sp. 4H-3-7+YE-5]MBN25025.1 DNA-binding response regulator [Alteromonadaceae bacterium]MBJ2135661.1 response regulator transcription factor [Paraglaciecola chathamensis]MBU3018910.1 response regulator transcription factor [Paraglaciecola agarilytica]MDO6560380.1 response regulator transcription factor [Paraglaciecola chathamensis]|tara:strand:+ start:5460 stop:6119 length:660 start_codon:yes stop_codon:yes gene_type:complete